MARTIRIESPSAALTRKIGLKFARFLETQKSKKSLLVKLEGGLGAGKTTFVKGILSHFGIRPAAVSPTFVIAKRYAPKKNGKAFQNIFHIDAYRLSSLKDFKMLGWEKISRDPGALILLEWPRNIKGLKSNKAASVSFQYGKKRTERILSISF